MKRRTFIKTATMGCLAAPFVTQASTKTLTGYRVKVFLYLSECPNLDTILKKSDEFLVGPESGWEKMEKGQCLRAFGEHGPTLEIVEIEPIFKYI